MDSKDQVSHFVLMATCQKIFQCARRSGFKIGLDVFSEEKKNAISNVGVTGKRVRITTIIIIIIIIIIIYCNWVVTRWQ